ncbi:MAG: Snf7 family protein [Candidatus Bathyarchaeota archaeon]|nr:Snf7 family protein [Candidatus Bathyarchaeota archaeon]MDH5532285.1 Snf7 family protein [Candidatus Bathyarchaeota archaeon]MDH5713338.1 Snf7 family protein [Candidatus Bathyarchaeota archaeon]
MSEKFARKWGEGKDGTPLTTRIKEAIRSPRPLRPRLDYAIKRIQTQIERLDKATNHFSERDKSIFAKVVEAYSKHDMARANVFANELAAMRKMEKTIIHSRLALEQIVLRLSTVSELGDVVSTLAPAVGVMRGVRNGMAAVFPEAERELGSIGNLLNGIMMDAGHSTGVNIDFQTASEDAQTILNEAATVAEHKVQEKFPELPAGMLAFDEAAQTET